MTTEQLQELAESTLAGGVAELLETGSVHQSFYLLKRGGGADIWVTTGDVTNSEDAKRGLAVKLRARIAQGDIEAVVMLSDAYFATNVTPANDAIRQKLRMTIEEANAFGLCEKREGVIVHAESPLAAWHCQQEYRRNADGKIELVGPRVVESDIDGRAITHRARFTQWFPTGRG